MVGRVGQVRPVNVKEHTLVVFGDDGNLKVCRQRGLARALKCCVHFPDPRRRREVNLFTKAGFLSLVFLYTERQQVTNLLLFCITMSQDLSVDIYTPWPLYLRNWEVCTKIIS